VHKPLRLRSLGPISGVRELAFVFPLRHFALSLFLRFGRLFRTFAIGYAFLLRCGENSWLQ
jgi:hypothetical protein